MLFSKNSQIGGTCKIPAKFLKNVVGHFPIEDALYKCIIINNITVLSLQKSEEQFDNNS